MAKTKLHALRFRCGVCHYASNDKYPEFHSEAQGPIGEQLYVTVMCSKCQAQRTIHLGTLWRERKHE